jgi:hypothetical protein
VPFVSLIALMIAGGSTRRHADVLHTEHRLDSPRRARRPSWATTWSSSGWLWLLGTFFPLISGL